MIFCKEIYNLICSSNTEIIKNMMNPRCCSMVVTYNLVCSSEGHIYSCQLVYYRQTLLCVGPICGNLKPTNRHWMGVQYPPIVYSSIDAVTVVTIKFCIAFSICMILIF
jgi:hypothetical protein